jgi:ketosteroid isomerase-like protein
MPDKQKITETLIALESAALERWGNGDPSGFLEISASDVVYFDPYLDKRIDGIEALTQYYKTFWGQVRLDRFELIDPCVQISGELAVLTFNYASYTGDKASRWNCTEVYRQSEGDWKIIQTHWSYTHHPGIVGN